MKITNNNNIGFKAVVLNNANYNEIKNASLVLDLNGFKSSGIEKCYISNDDVKTLQKLVKDKRHDYLDGTPQEFKSIYLPWNRKGIILSTPLDEQYIYNVLKDFHKNTKINLLL